LRTEGAVEILVKKYMTNMYCLDTMRQVSLTITTLAKKKLLHEMDEGERYVALLHEMDEGERYVAYILSNERG
jgi:hypothetical protein